MHPIEHVYYVTSVSISLLLYLSPFHLLFNAMHLILSPAASHSGWEDNWQSDLYHYLHHYKFEVNYGVNSETFQWDKLFGTFCDKLDLGDSYKGKKPLKSYIPNGFEVSDFLPNSFQMIIFNLFTISYFTLIISLLRYPAFFDGEKNAHLFALVCSVGPIFFSILLCLLSRDSLPALWPFHKEKLSSLVFHFVSSTLLCVVPVYFIFYLILKQ